MQFKFRVALLFKYIEYLSSFSQNQRMQQPLAHLYFFTVLEHLQAQNHELSGLVRNASLITEQCASSDTGKAQATVLWVELQAVVQVILQELATHLDPEGDSGDIYLLTESINR